MPRLIYSAITSLDGCVADEGGSFEWAAPDVEVHAFVNELERGIGTYLYGRRMYETMASWESMPLDEQPDVVRDFAQIWRAADKVVFSRTLEAPSSARTRIERSFEPHAITRMKEEAARDLSVGGAERAGQALRAGLIDECHVFLNPVVVGGGQLWLPRGLRLSLELVGERQFENGVVHLYYRISL